MGPVVLVAALLLLTPGSSQADRSYTVRQGDTLAAIARRHRITVAALRGANRLEGAGNIRPGQQLRVPDRGVVFVAPGQSLSAIARSHDVSVRDLARANRIRESSPLRVGRRLVLPGHQVAQDQQEAEQRWGRTRNPGVVTLVRMQDRQRARFRMVNRGGRVRQAALRRLRPIMRSRRTGRTRLPNRRLAAMLANVSDHFGGRTLYVVSGFRAARGYTRASSRHTAGRAIDFRIRGVPNSAVRDYCRTLPNAGVGFYPRSSFVHLDARDSSAYWVDWSRPGEAPRYGPENRPPADPGADGEVTEGEPGPASEGPPPSPAAEAPSETPEQAGQETP